MWNRSLLLLQQSRRMTHHARVLHNYTDTRGWNNQPSCEKRMILYDLLDFGSPRLDYNIHIHHTHTPYIHAKINVSLQNNYAVYIKCTQSSLQVALEIKQGIWYKRAFISMCRARTVGYFVIDRRLYATSVSCLAGNRYWSTFASCLPKQFTTTSFGCIA